MPARTPVQPVQPPSEEEIRARLGHAFPLFQALMEDADLRPEWKFYGPKYGWSLKLFEKKRNLCFVGVEQGELSIAFILGEKALARALDADLPAPLADKVRHARTYPEGYGVTLSVSKKADLDSVRRLLEIKRAG